MEILHDSTAVYKKSVKYFDKMVNKKDFLKIISLYLFI